MSGEDVGQKPMRSGKPHHQAPPGLQDLGSDINKVAPKALPLPAHHFAGQGDLGNPLAEIPSQPGNLQPCRVAHKLRHRHAPPGDPVAKLLDHVFLVAALISKIDDLPRRIRARQIGQHQPITKMRKERPLSIVLFDQNPPHDHPTWSAKSVGLISDLAHPLLYRAQGAKAAHSRFLATPVRCAHVTRGAAALLAIGSRHKGLPALLHNRLDQRRTLAIEPSRNGKVRSLIDDGVENVRAVKVRIPTNNGVSKMAPDPRQHFFKSLCRRVRRAGATRLIDYLKALPAAAERNHQRLIRPTPVVAEIGSFLLYPIKRLDVPVEIYQRKLVLLSPTTHLARKLRPHRLLNLVDYPGKLLDILQCPEATQEIPGRGRIWNPTGSYQPSNRLAPLQRRLVLQTCAVGIQRVGERQHVVRLVIRCVALEQPQRAVQSRRHPKPPHKLLRQHQSSIVRHLATWIALEMQQRVTHHPTLGLGPRKFFKIDTRTRIDVTCALKCDRYFHLGALCFWGYVVVLQLFVYLISEGFSRSLNPFSHSNYPQRAYLKTSTTSVQRNLLHRP